MRVTAEAGLADREPCGPADVVCSARQLFESGKPEEGMRLLQTALIADHRHVPTLIAYADAQREYGLGALAEEACRMALESEPDNIDARLMLGRILHETGRTGAALEIVEAVLGPWPDHERARIYQAVLLKAAGRFDEARRVLLDVIRDNPKALGAYPVLADLETFAAGHPVLQQMESVVAEAADNARLPALYFALGKAHDDIGDHQAAFAHFAEGARRKRAGTYYDEADTLTFFDEVMETFDRGFIESRRITFAPKAAAPVFIVGMPRSGSTLIERILSTHPDAHSEGEAKSFAECLAGLPFPEGVDPAYPPIARQMTTEHLALLSARYATYAEARAYGARIFINKLLGNFFFLGLIHMALPQAKFIVSRRDPIDTCLSAFTTLFGEPMPYTYDLAELGRYYRKYEQLMDHWQAVLPRNVLMECRYEELVADLEGNARALLRFVDLPWNEDCLAFERSSLPVRTASVTQVRRPIYRSSVGRWRRYERQLQPLIEALADG